MIAGRWRNAFLVRRDGCGEGVSGGVNHINKEEDRVPFEKEILSPIIASR
jgi:hypothetical protein